MVDVDDEDGDDDGEGDEDHDEEQILSDQRDHLGTNQRCQSAERPHPEFPPPSLGSSLRPRRPFALHFLLPSDCLLIKLTRGVSGG